MLTKPHQFIIHSLLQVCPQVGLWNDTIRSDEDCLYLNNSNNNNSSSSSGEAGLLPVLVWVHGGGYIAGSGTSDEYNPLFYLAHDIIVVSIRWSRAPSGKLQLQLSHCKRTLKVVVAAVYKESAALLRLLARYRLGVLGFLSLATEDVPGNAGVRDQVMMMIVMIMMMMIMMMMIGGRPHLGPAQHRLVRR